MTPVVTGYIGIAALLIILISEMPIGYSMALIGFLGFLYINGFEPALGLLRQVPYEFFSSYNLSVVPLFLLMGSFALTAGLNEKLYRIVYKWLGHFRGGLAMATIGGCAFFSAISGSSVATAATMATVALPEMRKYNYAPTLATGSVAAGGTIGILIPPSVILIIYGIIAEQSIGKLFLAGFFPGVLEALFYVLTIAIVVRISPNLGPRGPKFHFREKLADLGNVWEVTVLFICVIGGIYSGAFTPTEAGGVGAFGAFFFAVIRKRLSWKNFWESLLATTKNTGMCFIIVMGAMIFGYFLAVSRVPFDMASFVSELPVNRYIILWIILMILALLGCVMDSMAIVLLTVPIFFPVIMRLGFDPIWFGILTVRVTEMGLITPPIGLNVYIIKGISGLPMGTVFRGVIPFVIADICHVALLIAFPSISLFLPNLMD
jgi:C4-dicarboxylate transporter DctM subunit